MVYPEGLLLADMVRIVKASFITSAARPEQAPAHDLAEVGVLGRSNVGKSSLINALCRMRHLAKTSSTPGKTRLINFFDVSLREPEGQFCLVDLPGYGYAKAGRSQQEAWNQQADRFLHTRTRLRLLVHLLDCRHDPTELDCQMRGWLQSAQCPMLTVLTKTDKLSRQQLHKQTRRIRECMGAPKDEVWIPCSATKKQGIDRLVHVIAESLGILQAETGEAPVIPGVSDGAC